ncbi:hypothetical protein T440DRAFT_497919 [Plenodomus tracheiphilus IPT5]|uniref:Fucose-specific lectin n=1 Tax=Plenodomus tracheiphilus IPT5 TaxID=1408161 RepID=A0A6A7BA66_9PLEO|nr:hypothetical protein T440DRAFT_497919 [Plenodomus tracheiphilus IPT5]
MDHQQEHHDDTSSPLRYTNSDWSPPPQFQELDQPNASGAFSEGQLSPCTPPVTHPPLHEHVDVRSEQQQWPQEHDTYRSGYPTEKESPYNTYQAAGSPTPEYSAPQVVPGQFFRRSIVEPPMPPSSDGGTLPIFPPRLSGITEHVNQPGSLSSDKIPVPEPVNAPEYWGMKKRKFFVLVGCVLIWVVALALGLGLGLGLGLKNDSSDNDPAYPLCRSSPQLCIGGAINADYVSRRGAFNGTGIALAGESWNTGHRRIFTLYFQHHTGDIRFMQYTTDRKWIGGTKAETVASDAKDATPISAVSFAANSTQYFHIFYINKNSTVRQLTRTNETDIWQPGPLDDLNLKAYDSPTDGLQACWKGNYYGDSDYSKFPTASGLTNQQHFDERLGMNIWFAVDNSTFHQYAWYNGQDTWVPIQEWKGFNGHAGVGCYSWGEGTSTYAMLVNEQNDVEFWWKDTNTTRAATQSHPINTWTNASSAAIKGVYPATSLGFTTYFYAQMADKSIKGYNITYASEHTKFVEDETFTITDPAGPVQGLGGTHLSVTAFAERDAKRRVIWDSLYVFYQSEGDDITAFTRPLAGGEWTKGKLAIPQE